MEKVTKFLLKQYRKMPGSKKIRIALKLSKLARIVRKEGMQATGA